MDGKADAFMGQSRAVHMGPEMNQRRGQQFDRQQGRRQNRFQGSVKEFTCNNYNNNYCKESQDHMDTNLPQKYIHACTNCYGNPAIPAREQRHKLKHCKNTAHQDGDHRLRPGEGTARRKAVKQYCNLLQKHFSSGKPFIVHSWEQQGDGSRAQRKQGGWNSETFDHNIDSKGNLVKSSCRGKFLFQRHFRDSKGNLVKSAERPEFLFHKHFKQTVHDNRALHLGGHSKLWECQKQS